jgi:RNA-directed DNA polymerase
VRNESKEAQPALVFERTKQAGEVRARWAWTEPAIWTDRMLTALEEGVKGGKWFSLCDKAFSDKSLRAAFEKVKANRGAPGVDGWTVKRFEGNLERELPGLISELLSGTYRPQAIKRVWIPKPGSHEKRPLGIPTVRDRVVQAALRACLEPIFEKDFKGASFGFRPGRSCHKALSRVWRGLKNGKAFVVDADLKRCFDTLPHGLIMRGLEEKISDGKVLTLVQAYLLQGVMEDGTVSSPVEGTPQGSVISPLLANIALHGLDSQAQEQGYELIRYADDFVVLCKDRDEAASALDAVRAWTERNGLTLHPDKTRIVDHGAGETFDFLGFTFRKGSVFPRKKSLKKFRDNVREKTPRLSGKSLKAVICELNPVLRGWHSYFKASPVHVFRDADSFVRRRLRALLSKRIAKHPAHRRANSLRWPTAFFHSHGLISMQVLAKGESS